MTWSSIPQNRGALRGRVIHERSVTLHVWPIRVRHAFQFRRPAPATLPLPSNPRKDTLELKRRHRNVPHPRSDWSLFPEGVAGVVYSAPPLLRTALSKRPCCPCVEGLFYSPAPPLLRLNPSKGARPDAHRIWTSFSAVSAQSIRRYRAVQVLAIISGPSPP